MEYQTRITFMGILVEVVNPAGVKAARAPFDAMHLVTLRQQQLRQVAAVLASYACDESFFDC